MNAIKVFGIKNCDSVKKALNWLNNETLDFQFIDFRRDGIDQESIKNWTEELGWQKLINKRSTSWRLLNDDKKLNLDNTRAVELMLQQPTLIKRPVLTTGSIILVGFDATKYASLLTTT